MSATASLFLSVVAINCIVWTAKKSLRRPLPLRDSFILGGSVLFFFFSFLHCNFLIRVIFVGKEHKLILYQIKGYGLPSPVCHVEIAFYAYILGGNDSGMMCFAVTLINLYVS